MRKLTILTALLLSACATPQRQTTDPATEALAKEPLTCADKTQCDMYWQRAQLWIVQHSSWRIQTATDVLIQTFGPGGYTTQLAYVVLRMNNQDGSAKITISPRCDNFLGCEVHPHRAAIAFKNYVKGKTTD